MDIHWRNTQKPARFFFLDARSFAAVLFVLVYARIWTFCLVFFVMLAFWFFEQKGLTFFAAIRAFRSWLLGRHRPANVRRARRRRIDFGGR